jgi:bifunctional non-homologous end joining protein LigD
MGSLEVRKLADHREAVPRAGARGLERYNAMRDFAQTDEPSGKVARSETGRSFVVQKHAARRLHYDFRLELDGVLLSWAVPKGPSLDPKDKRLAVQTEDHPVDYRDFEGTIPEGQYGGGAVIVWDRGTWEPIGDPRAGMKRGRLDFVLEGTKLHGRFVLVRTKGKDGEKKPRWLLIKRSDEHVEEKAASIVETKPGSVLTGRTVEEVEAGEDQDEPLPAPGSIAPQLATLVKDVPTVGEYVYEIKFDGYRTLAWLDDGKVRLYSRRGLDWTKHYPTIGRALSRVRARNAVFDGEVAYVLPDGKTSFQKLQNTLHRSDSHEHARLVYFVFDLLFYHGQDLRDEPLLARKEKLRTILAGEDLPLRLSDHVTDGRAFFREVCKLGLEGVIGKRADRGYVSGRTPDWIKIKCEAREEFVVVGFTPPKGSRKGIGALLIATHDGKALKYAGKVGTGFSSATLSDLSKRLAKIVTTTPPVVNPPRMPHVTWVEPDLVAQVRYGEWTDDGVLRHPSFEGLRFDKKPEEVEKERPRDSAIKPGPALSGIVITHPDRVMDEQTGLTKHDLAAYVASVADTMLPFVKKRPLMLVRCPSGTGAGVMHPSEKHPGRKCFVQKHLGKGVAESNIGLGQAGDEEVVFVENADQLVWLAQNNTVEMHGWGSTMPKWDRPDWIVLDLDPDEALPFSRVRDAAREVREALRSLSLESWLKTTGGKGLHVVVPIARRYDWETVRGASEAIAVLMSRAAPDRYVANMSKKARAKKIFIDYLRNAEGATAVLPYSPRARPGLPVAVPISWDDLDAIDPSALTIATVPKLLARRRKDPWADLLASKQRLPIELVRAAKA